jgi:hypothetical protein
VSWRIGVTGAATGKCESGLLQRSEIFYAALETGLGPLIEAGRFKRIAPPVLARGVEAFDAALPSSLTTFLMFRF